jgi:hypothetical protein
LKKQILFLLVFFRLAIGHAQNLPPVSILDLATVKDSVAASNYTLLFIDSNQIANLNNLSKQQFVPLESYERRKRLPIRMITKPIYLHIHIINGKSSIDSLYFYPGFLFTEVDIYKETNNGQLEKVREWGGNTGYTGFELQPMEEAQLLFCIKSLQNGCRRNCTAIYCQELFDRLYRTSAK